MKSAKRFPIKTVSLQTGLSLHVIRAWEKRYQIIMPWRTDTNRRLYSENDIALLALLHEATKSGHSIGSIADMDELELRQLLSKNLADKPASNGVEKAGEGTPADMYLGETVHAVVNFDAVALENVLLRASVDLTQPVLINHLIIPLLDKIGELWQDGSIRIMHEHLAVAIIGPFLTNLRKAYRPDKKAPVLVVCTPSGQVHEMGAQIIALVAAAEGWRVVYLGSDLPAVEIAAAALKEKAQVIALSITHPFKDPLLEQELLKLPAMLPAEVKIVIGGRGAINYQRRIGLIKAELITDLEYFRRFLSTPDI